MDPATITKGSVITVHPYTAEPNKDVYHIVVKRVGKRNGLITIFDSSVHHFYSDGTYSGISHYKEPYEFPEVAFKNGKITPTDEKTIRKIEKVAKIKILDSK